MIEEYGISAVRAAGIRNDSMDITKIDHVGIAVSDLATAVAQYTGRLGLDAVHTETVESQGVRVAFIQVGQSTIELLEPLAPDTAVGKFIAKRGDGLHHICFAVDNIVAALADLAANGASLIDTQPRPGAHGKLVAFVHPRTFGGTLIELAQPMH